MLVGFFPESLDQDPPSAVADGEQILDEEDRIDQILQPGQKERPLEQGGTRDGAQDMQGSGESQRERLELAQRLFMRALDVAPGYSAASIACAWGTVWRASPAPGTRRCCNSGAATPILCSPT